MRAILDCKFNEFYLNRPFSASSLGMGIGTQWCSFPTFALCWLNKFQVGDNKKI